MKHLILAVIALAALFSSADAKTLDAKLKAERTGDTVQYELTFQQPFTEPFLLWVWQGNGRRADGGERASLSLEPSAPGVYRFTLPAKDGQWRYYGRIGIGQAGYIASGDLFMPSGTGPITMNWQMWNSFEDTVPEYVQPVGYAVYFLIAAFAFGGTAFVLRQLARRNTATA